ncbi:hypothetical protein TWF694_003791 [Orbilia ellipsospora]|uniref:F-box domain-containing protein n=1 Tax=Orbilia ellipsospora TaxID=2528407 RepID=A0AAV9WZ97_9PEZI
MARRTVALPYDVLCVVASFINSHRDLLSFCLANRETRDAALPFLNRDIFFESWPDIRDEGSTGSGDWFRVGDPVETLFSSLYRDIQRAQGQQKRAIHVKSFRHIVITEESDRRNDRTQDMAKNQLVYLVESLPRLEELQVSIEDLTLLGLESAISSSTISQLHITPHQLLTYSCDSRRLAQSTPRFLPLWGNISSTNLKSLTITGLLPSCRHHLDRFTIPGSVEIWSIISNCPNLKTLDVRVKMNGRDRGHNYINDHTGRAVHGAHTVSDDSPDSAAVPAKPIVHLTSLRLENCTLSSFEFNRLGPLSLENMHIPYNGRKRIFRYLGSGASTGTIGGGMIFPKNLKSMVVDTLPLGPDRREPWQQLFDQGFKELELEELVVLTKRTDFYVQTLNGPGAAWIGRNGEDLMPNTMNEAVGMITGVLSSQQQAGRSRYNASASASAVASANSTATGSSSASGGITSQTPDLGEPQSLEPGMGCWLKRLLMKGKWEMTKGLLDTLLTTCWNLEELGVALRWRDWDHNISTFPPHVKRLRHLKTLIILNEPQSTNMNAEWGSPLPTKNKIWGSKMALDDDQFLQFGQPQERLRHFGIGKKMWSVVLEDEEAEYVGSRSGRRYQVGSTSASTGSRGNKRLRRTLREVDRDGVEGVGILEWIKFCDECWVGEFADKTI